MEFPYLPYKALTSHNVTAFAGLDRSLGAKLPSFSCLENLTAAHYPALTPRAPRTRVLHQEVDGLSTDNGLCYVLDGGFYIAGNRVLSGLSQGQKQLVSMGAKVVIFPDKKWVNTVDLSSGSLEAYEEDEAVSFTLVDSHGVAFSAALSPDAPEDPRQGDLWLTENALLQYDGQDFLPVPTWVRISLPGAGFAAGDVVNITGIQMPSGSDLNGYHSLFRVEGEAMTIQGFCLPGTQPAAMGKVTVSRRLPEMDLVFECGNRLWGCRYGTDNQGAIVNEIYCSRLGDPTNWEDFSGTAADAWRASLGSQGAFTGGISYLGQPLFFKEGSLHRVYGSYTGQFGIDSLDCRGVQKGSERSLAVVEEVLYYLSSAGVCRYDGSLPIRISQALGDWQLTQGIAGSFRGDYYLWCLADGQQKMLVYTPGKGLWHSQNPLEIKAFAADTKRLYGSCDDGIWVLGEGLESPQWSAQTPPLTLEGYHATKFCKLALHLKLPLGSRMEILASYDGGEFEPIASLEGALDPMKKLCFRPRRCQQFSLRLEGQGDMALLGLGIYTRQGGRTL